jgi:hypothetical protein
MVQQTFTDSETPFSWIQRCMDLLACELEMGLGALLSLKAATPDLSDCSLDQPPRRTFAATIPLLA